MRVPFTTLRARLDDPAEASSASSSDTEHAENSQPPHREPLSRYLSEPGPRSPSIHPQNPERRGSFHDPHPTLSPMITGEERPDPPPVDPGPSRRNSFPAIPTYDEALAAIPDASQGAGHARALTLSAYTSMEGPSLVGITTFGDDEDDPLVPRLLRAPPERVPRPLRRQTDPLPSHPAPSAAPENAPIEEESTENTTEAEQTETAGVVQARLDPLAQGQATLELPGAPADALPSYSPHLARDELRLISTVHLDQNHPAAAFFSAMTASAITANPLASPPPATDEQSTGGKKLKLTLTSGGETVQGSGRLFVRMGRAGVVEGKIHVGKVDHATGLEVSIIGLVNTSYYVRGQYTLIDTLPLARRQITLYPPPIDDATEAGANGTADTQANGTSTTNGSTQANGTSTANGTGANGPTSNGPTAAATGTPSSTANGTSTTATSTTNGTTPPTTTTNDASSTPLNPIQFYGESPTRRTSSQPIEPHAPYVISNDGAHGAMTDAGTPYDPSTERSNPVKNFDFRHFKKLDPVYEDFVPQFSEFSFSIRMPEHYYRDEQVALPPSAQIFQVGMQAAVEYFLRIKLTRKSWRLNEAIGIPIIYEPRAFVTPRRLRALTTDDVLNPGWRTIRLHGGAPHKSSETTPAVPSAPGVEVTLLLPSPPILYIPTDQPPPPIPFHLHFHSSSTLPLATFSDPNECHFIIRLMRVASMRIGTEREMRRLEIPSKVEIWQEGGPHLTLGADARPNNSTAMPATASGARPGSSGSAPATTGTDASSTPNAATRRRSFSERAPSFLRRRSSSTNTSGPASSTSPTSPVSPTTHGNVLRSMTTPNEPTISEEPQTTNGDAPPPADAPPSEERTGTESVLTPLPLGATDVHLLGQLTLSLPESGPLLLRTLVQSFMTPEIGVTYVLEVGLQPRSGAVKEAFTHVWGGGLIELVLGPRREDDRSMRTGLVPVLV